MKFFFPLVCAALAIVLQNVNLPLARATYKPEYDRVPAAVRQWFQDAELTPAAHARLNYRKCCDHADRLRTKFVPRAGGAWSFYVDPACTHDGCALAEIPNDVVHDDEIRAPANADAQTALEFAAMKREGVLFIYNGAPTCFWPPEPGI